MKEYSNCEYVCRGFIFTRIRLDIQTKEERSGKEHKILHIPSKQKVYGSIFVWFMFLVNNFRNIITNNRLDIIM